MDHVVGREEFPLSINIEKGEILCMVVEILGIVVERHPSELLFHLHGILRDIACQCEQRFIVHLGWVDTFVEQSTGCNHVDALAIGSLVETFLAKISTIEELEPWYGDACFLGSLVVHEFYDSRLYGIVEVTELDNPSTPIFPQEYLGAYTS